MRVMLLLCNENGAARHRQDILSDQEKGRIFFLIDNRQLYGMLKTGREKFYFEIIYPSSLRIW